MSYRKNITMKMTTDDVQDLLAEQNKEANLILNKLRSEAIRLYHQQHSSFDIGTFNEIQFKEASILLSLDDMNIRGQQIVDGNEWAQGDTSKLYEAISQRSVELVQYINSRTAERYLNLDTLEDAVAVTNGASFKHSNIEKLDLLMDSSKAKEFLKNSLEKKTIDYSKLDIYRNDTTKEEGIKICEAHGFKLGFESEPIENCTGQEMNNYLFTNDKGDILITTATDDDFCYGGCEIRGARDTNTRFKDSFSEIQSNFYEKDGKNCLQFIITYHDNNMFSLYDRFVAHDDRLVPNEQKEIGGLEGIPIPEFIKSYTIEKEMPNLKSRGMESVYVADTINILKLDDYISQMSEECRKIYEPIAKKSIDIVAEDIASNSHCRFGESAKIIDSFPYIQEKLNLSKETMEKLLNITYDKLKTDIEHTFDENLKSDKSYVLKFIEENRDSLIEQFEEYDSSNVDQEQSFDDFLKDAHDQADKINQQTQDKNISKDIGKEYER